MFLPNFKRWRFHENIYSMIVVMVRVGNLISLSQQFYVGKWSYGPFAPQPNDTHKSRVFRMRLTDKTKMQKKNSK